VLLLALSCVLFSYLPRGGKTSTSAQTQITYSLFITLIFILFLNTHPLVSSPILFHPNQFLNSPYLRQAAAILFQSATTSTVFRTHRIDNRHNRTTDFHADTLYIRPSCQYTYIIPSSLRQRRDDHRGVAILRQILSA
jgi:hypothetical protein